jgi:hypothetical protein
MAKEALLASYQISPPDASLVVGDPVADLKFNHSVFAAGYIEFERAIEGVRGLLIIIKHKATAHGGNRVLVIGTRMNVP